MNIFYRSRHIFSTKNLHIHGFYVQNRTEDKPRKKILKENKKP